MRRAPAVVLHPDQRRQLADVADSPQSPKRLALRASIVLRAADGAENSVIAEALHTSAGTAALWRRRFLRHGVAGVLRDAPRPGRPTIVSTTVVQAIVRSAGPAGSLSRSSPPARQLAEEFGVSKSTVQRIRIAYGIHPRPSPAKISNDAGLTFLDRVTDLVGLYLNPPERAVAFSTDERLRPNPFRARGPSAASQDSPQSRAAEFLKFLQMTERETPAALDVHLLVDGRLAPVPREISRWLDRRRRFHLHFLRSDRVGLALIDRLIEGFSRRKDRPGASASAHRLQYALREHLLRDRDSLRPFVWTAASGDIRGAHGRISIQQ